VSVDTWMSMSSTQRLKAADACYKLLATEKTVTSTDGTLKVPTTPGAGKKAHQRKRKRAEKTTTAKSSKRRMFVLSDDTSDDNAV